ncbi:MAG: hypothetical protein AB7H70_01825 [Rhodospirillaceae bacterium]
MTLEELLETASATEREERMKHGLPPAHVLDIAEFPFKFAAPLFKQAFESIAHWVAAMPAEPRVHLFSACANVLSGDYRAADAALEKLRALTKSPLALMQFGGPVARQPIQLPPVTGTWPREAAFFVSCDNQYFETYGIPLLRSLAAASPGCPIHVHIIGEPVVLPDVALKITTTLEPQPVNFRLPDYYGAARLVRFAEGLEASQVPLVMIDADALVTANPRHLLAQCNDVTLRIRAGRIEPWHHFSACYIGGSPACMTYFRRVADIVLRTIDASFWGLDQYALFAAYVQLSPRLNLIGPDIAGVDAEIPGVFWFTAGNEKKNLASADSSYARLFRSFAAHSSSCDPIP